MSWKRKSCRWDPTPKEQMRNTEKAYQKNKRIAALLQHELYGPKGIETTKRLTIDDIDDQRAILETDLSRMSREAQKNALLSENENNNGDTSNGGKTVQLMGVNSDDLDLLEEAEFEILEDERETSKKNQLLGDFGRNFHGYISRPGQNHSSLSEKKIKKEYSRVNQYYHQSNIRRTNPRIRRLLEVEKMKQESIFRDEIKSFGTQKNPTFDEGNKDPLKRVLEKHESKAQIQPLGGNDLAFGRQKAWRPTSGRKMSRRTALDDFNFLNVLLPKIIEQKPQSVGHRDQRGIFISEQNKDDLLAKLGILDTDQSAHETARKGSVWDIGQVADTFAPDGHIRTALTMPDAVSMDEIRKSRYLKTDKPSFFDIEITPSQLFNNNISSSQVMVDRPWSQISERA